MARRGQDRCDPSEKLPTTAHREAHGLTFTAGWAPWPLSLQMPFWLQKMTTVTDLGLSVAPWVGRGSSLWS